MPHLPLPPRHAAALSDAAETAAFVDLFAAAPAPLRAAVGLDVRRVAGATLLLAPRLPTAMFNRVIGWGMGDEAAAPADLADLPAIEAAYRAAGSPEWWLHWNPHARPAGLDAALRERGWRVPARHYWAKMLRAATPAARVDTALRIDVATDAEADATAQAIVQAFGMPPPMAAWLRLLHGRPRWTLHAARDAGTGAVVGGACLFVDGPLAWLGMGAVLPSHRRRGGQQALMARRIDDARAQGAEWIATETGEPIADEPNPSLANMRRAGFEPVASRANLAPPPAVT